MRRAARGLRIAVGMLVTGASIDAEAQVAPGTTERVSLSSSEQQANHMSGRRGKPDLSLDGSIVVFDSLASNLVTGDTNAVDDVFVRDRLAGVTTRVSVTSAGAQANGISIGPSVSDDGMLVVFESEATNLVTPDGNGTTTDVYLHNRATGVTARVNVSTAGVQGNASAINAQISGDGRYVLFASSASNLVSGKTTIYREIYVRDLLLGTTERVSLTNAGAESNGNSLVGVISADGRHVAFNSFATNLVPSDTNLHTDIFVRDRVLGTTERVSVTSAEAESDNENLTPSISADGRYVAFASDSTNLVPGDANEVRDVFVRDRVLGTTERVSVTNGGLEADGQSVGPGIRGGSVFGPLISGDGRYVVFDSSASNLVEGDTNTCEAATVQFLEPGTCPDVFVRDRTAGTTTRFSVDSAGGQADSASTDPAISANGLSVAFFSIAANLASGDTNTCSIPPLLVFNDPGECPDIYARDAEILAQGLGEAPGLTAGKIPGGIRLQWGSGCPGSVADYGIYEGQIGSWYTHTALDCDDDGLDFVEDVVPSSGDTYYLVVPLGSPIGTPTAEGSYGQATGGAERPAGTVTCAPAQQAGTCP